MIRTRMRIIRVWRPMILTLMLALAVLAPAASAHAGLPPLPPITPIFPPWLLSALSASQPATITGYVQDNVGSPVASATVEISGDTSSSSVEAANFTQRAVTDGTGHFVITDVIQGTYQMIVNQADTSSTVLAFAEADPWHQGDDGAGIPDTRVWIQGGHTHDAGVIRLPHAASVTGRTMAGPTPVAGVSVFSSVAAADGLNYARWTTSAADGRYTFNAAMPGTWTVTYSGSGDYVPTDAVPDNYMGGNPVITTTDPAEASFAVAAGATINRGDRAYVLGQEIYSAAFESAHSSSYNISGISVTATSVAEPDIAYHWYIEDAGHSVVVLPAGEYNIAYHDDQGCYNDGNVGMQLVTSGGSMLNIAQTLTPAANTFAIYGHIYELPNTSSNVDSWVSVTPVDPAGWSWPTRRVISNGSSNSLYLIRVPSNTGLPGNQYRVEIDDHNPNYTDTTLAIAPRHLATTFTIAGSSTDVLHNVGVAVGGTITGQVTDDLGNPVRGVTVSAQRKGVDLSWGPETTWLNSLTAISDPWVAITDSSGNFVIGGLPTDSDYKVTYNPDYNPGWPLSITYRDYNRRVYHNRQLTDGFNEMVSPPVVDHDPVAVSAGATVTGIDTQIRPGGYVAVHADGPTYPTGAVYCDVMYQVGGAWSEVDSGFTTGGTFQKLWKVLPAGHYRLDYSDYFGRGAGSRVFDLAEGEHKYLSIVVPVPISGPIPSPSLKGAFDGTINGGMMLGGSAGLQLSVTQLGAPPSPAPPPANYINAGSIFNFSASGATADGTWSLTMPYDPSIPDGDVGSLRVLHYLDAGGTESLVPFKWDTTAHTLTVQASSLSPFRVMFMRHAVTLGTPSTSKTISHKKNLTVTGTLSPHHAKGNVKSVQLLVYKRNSRGKYVSVFARIWATNADYRTITKYSASFKLGKGVYRIYAYAPADTLHLATTTAGYAQVTVN